MAASTLLEARTHRGATEVMDGDLVQVQRARQISEAWQEVSQLPIWGDRCTAAAAMIALVFFSVHLILFSSGSNVVIQVVVSIFLVSVGQSSEGHIQYLDTG